MAKKPALAPPMARRSPAPTPTRQAAPRRNDAHLERVKVQATRMGFHDLKRRRPGDVFMVRRKDINPSWMREVSAGTPERQTTGNQALKRHHDVAIEAKLTGGIMPDPPSVDHAIGGENVLED